VPVCAPRSRHGLRAVSIDELMHPEDVARCESDAPEQLAPNCRNRLSRIGVNQALCQSRD